MFNKATYLLNNSRCLTCLPLLWYMHAIRSRHWSINRCINFDALLQDILYQRKSTSDLLIAWLFFFRFLPRCMECSRGIAMGILSVRLSVRLSVCPSVRQTRVLWQNGRKICPDFYTMRKIIQSSFMRRRMVGGGDPFYLKFWVNRPALERNRRFWTDNRP